MVSWKKNGRYGNQLFSYTLSRIISIEKGLQLLPFDGNYAHLMLSELIAGKVITNATITIDDSFENLEDILKFDNCHYHLDGYFQKAKFYIPYREQIKKWLRFKNPIDFKPSGNSVCCHIRRSDFIWSINSGAVNLSYYTNILDSISFDKLYIFGGCSHNNEQKDIDDVVIRTFEKYNPIYPNLDAITEFQMMMKFKTFIESNSTFSWWASFLNDEADIIYSPKTINGGYRDNDNLTIFNDSRYKYINNVTVEKRELC